MYKLLYLLKTSHFWSKLKTITNRCYWQLNLGSVYLILYPGLCLICQKLGNLMFIHGNWKRCWLLICKHAYSATPKRLLLGNNYRHIYYIDCSKETQQSMEVRFKPASTTHCGLKWQRDDNLLALPEHLTRRGLLFCPWIFTSLTSMHYLCFTVSMLKPRFRKTHDLY